MNKIRKILLGPSTFGAIDPAPLRLLEETGFFVVDNPYKRKLTRKELTDLLHGVHGIIAGLEPLDREVLAASDLKVISRCGSGMSNIDMDAAKEFGIAVYNTPFGPTQAVAELTVGCLITLIRKVTQMDRALHKGEWNKLYGRQLKGMKVLIIGYGNIGQRVGALLKALGAEIFASDPTYCEEDVACQRVENILEFLPAADVVTLHCSGEKEVIGACEFQAMKDGVFILNAGRGGLIDERALQEALDSAKVAGAWLDTFAKEPYNGQLISYEQVILTPHIGSYAIEGRIEMELESVRNLIMGFESIGA